MPHVESAPRYDVLAAAAVADANEALVRRFFSLLEAKDLDGWKAIWAEDGIYQIPYDDPEASYAVPFKRDGTVATVTGRDNIAELFTVIPTYVEKAELFDIVVRQTLDPEVLYVEFALAFLITKTGYLYRNLGIGRMQIRDGRVHLFREYLDLVQRQKGWAGIFFADTNPGAAN